MNVRSENDSDLADIWRIHAEAFPTQDEADLVGRLRDDGDTVFSLVAVSDGHMIGHVLFSRMQTPKGFLGLAPVAVLSSHRKRGIADALIRDGLARAKADGWRGVFVLGGDYYKRFGFDPALAATFSSPYAGPHLMALPLRPERLAMDGGAAEYPRAFSALA